MSPIRIIRNEDIETVLIGVPKSHKHLRVCIKLRKTTAWWLQEAPWATCGRD